MKHPKILPSLISMAVLSTLAPTLQAHVFYQEIPLTKSGKALSGTFTEVALMGSANGWVLGSKPRSLVQVMGAPGDAPFYRFHLDKPALVNIEEIAAAAPVPMDSDPKDRSTWPSANRDPAFSLYRGLVPQKAMVHEQSGAIEFDPAQPTAVLPPLPEDGSISGGVYYPAISKWDAAPNDPNISITIFDLDDNGFAKPSPIGVPKRINNPDWNLTISQLLSEMSNDSGNLTHPWRGEYLADKLQNLLATDANTTVSDWYQNTYQPHNGYRDTLNLTNFEGGICLEESPGADDLNFGNQIPGSVGGGCVIGIPRLYYYYLYQGEIDSLGDFSLPNEKANQTMNADYMASHPDYDPATMTICLETEPDGSPGLCAGGGNPAGVDWAKIYYLGHANRHSGEGKVEFPDTLKTDYSNIAAERLHGIYLTPGDYTIYANGGCSECYDHTGYGDPGRFAEYSDGIANPFDSHGGALKFTLNAWPVKECAAQQSGQQKPELSPLSGPWDVASGSSTSVDLHAYYCGNDVPQFQTKPGFTAETASPEAKTPNGWKSTLNWTAPTVSKAKLVTTTVTAAGSNGKSKSNAQKVTMRVWPEGLSPTNSFEVKNIKASWDAKKFKFKVTGKVVLKNANVLKPEEKQALFGNYLILRTGSDQFANLSDIMPSAKGVISQEQSADISSIPCTLKWHYRSQQGSVPVKNAPKDCIPDVPI